MKNKRNKQRTFSNVQEGVTFLEYTILHRFGSDFIKKHAA